MNTHSRRPSPSNHPTNALAVPARGSAYPSCLLVARPPRHDPSQHPLTWEDLLGRR